MVSALPRQFANRVIHSVKLRRQRWHWRALDLTDVTDRLGYVPRVALEVGANNGTDSLRMLEAFPGVSLHCFEPDPRAADIFESRLQGTSARLYRCAVGTVNGPITFHQSNGTPPGYEGILDDAWHGSGSIRAPKHHLVEYPWCRFDSEITVDSTSLDVWATKTGVDHVDFIWADVQGAERDLIDGGRNLLSRTRLFYTEYSNDELYEGQFTLPQLKAMLPGWRVLKKFNYDVLFENTELRRSSRRAGHA